MELYPTTIKLIGKIKGNHKYLSIMGYNFEKMMRYKRKEWRPVLKEIKKFRDDIFVKIPMKEEPIFELLWLACLSDYQRHVLREWLNCEKLNKSYKKMKKEGLENFETLIEKAKEFSISELAGNPNIRHKEMIRSPLCNDSTPSCCIYNDSNSWYCFATNQGGSTIDWQMKVNGMDFKQAVRSLI